MASQLYHVGGGLNLRPLVAVAVQVIDNIQISTLFLQSSPESSLLDILIKKRTFKFSVLCRGTDFFPSSVTRTSDAT